MMYVRKYICVILIVLTMGFQYCIGQAPASPAKYVRITTTVSTEVVGQLIREDANEILVRSDQGVDIIVYRANIVSIAYGTYSTISSMSLRTPLSAPQSFSSFGATLGTPAGLNIRYGYHDQDFGFHAMAGYLSSELYGFQLSPMYTISNSERTFFYFSWMLGYSYLTITESAGPFAVPVSREWAYAGFGFTLMSRGLILEAGLSGGYGDYSSPNILFQIGYMYSFY